MPEIPMPPIAMWKPNPRLGIVGMHSRYYLPNGPFDDRDWQIGRGVEIKFSSVALPHPSKRPPMSETIVVIPDVYVRLAGKKLPILDEIGGALAHAQMLARAEDVTGTADLNKIASLVELSATITKVRSGIWSMRLADNVRQAFFDDSVKAAADIVDPIAHAVALYQIFELDPGLITNQGIPPKALRSLAQGANVLCQAMAWQHVAARNERASFSRVVAQYGEKLITSERLIAYGMNERALTMAIKTERGLDLICIASVIHWVKGVLQASSKGKRELWIVTQPYQIQAISSQLAASLDPRYGLLGLHDLENPSKLTYHRECLALAIDRLTRYRKGLIKRAKG